MISLDDEIRVDAQCGRLLLAVRDDLLARRAGSPLAVGALCRGADLFLRDFVIDACDDNLLRLPVERIRQFAGHWYIVNTLEPDIAGLTAILDGIAACYSVLSAHALIDRSLAEAVADACADRSWYRQRLEDYWALHLTATTSGEPPVPCRNGADETALAKSRRRPRFAGHRLGPGAHEAVCRHASPAVSP